MGRVTEHGPRIFFHACNLLKRDDGELDRALICSGQLLLSIRLLTRSEVIGIPNARVGSHRTMKSCLALFLTHHLCHQLRNWTSADHQCCTRNVDLVNETHCKRSDLQARASEF